MFRQFQLDNTASPSNERADSFTELVAAHHDVVDTVDAFGAFGAFDAYFDEDTEVRLFEILFDAGSHPSDTIDESTDNDATNNDNTKGRRVAKVPFSHVHWSKPVISSHDTSCGSTSHTLAQNTLPTAHPFNTPVESCYWANLNLASTPRIPSSQTDEVPREERSSSSSYVVKSIPFLIRSDLALGELQVTESPFFALPLASEEQLQLSPSTVSNSSEPTRAGTSPFPKTPSDEPCEADDVVPRHAGPTGSSTGAPASPNGLLEVDSPRDKRSLPECVSGSISSEVEECSEEVSPVADAELVTSEPTPGTSSLTLETSVAEPGEAASVLKEQPDYLELAPEVPFPSSTIGQESHTLTVSQGTPPSRKRKRVAKSHAAQELRELSTLPPEHKSFSLPIREGRASKSGISRIRNVQLEAESCCHLAGDNGFCQFRDLATGKRKCMIELPKDDKVTRAHLAMHIDALGWREYSQLHPDWKPTCPWCNERPTKLEQLVRHILDTHLLMFMEWCPCGGTNSRSNTSTNRVRHVDSDVHKDYLRQQAGLVVVKDEEVDDGQEEFVQGSSKGTKRRRRR
ncbi:hypothetical protein ACEPAI_6631 [Sanghuangporus weigelae]